MKINFNASILDLDDKPIEQLLPAEDGKPAGKKTLTLGEVCAMALMASEPQERVDGAIKVQRLGLALRIKASMRDLNPLDLEAEEIVQLKEQVAKFYTTLVGGRVLMMLEGK